MTKKWARKESTVATHRCASKCFEGSDRGHLGKVPRTHSKASMLEQTLILPGTKFSVPTAVPWQKSTQEWTFNNILASQNGRQRFFSAIYGNMSWLCQVPKGDSNSSLTYESWSKQQIPSSKQFPREEKGDHLSKCVHTFWNRSSGKLNATLILED